ncbi:hypothetical protein BN7_1870 [Wickerhamomyces ciferrii]|uniref:Eukaryotic translation initiation factor 3 subunit G n=1 Tax=Wickerhamomyces ciferrii (strain ATCC 14091 / BCRC 22168 / CBS 111 / JCM 3599 / NBRC 0793 / NRRL Y-1031 F-60-10) TaxID=1206466 RepID=K0KH64_WICCF|nr:uncharacterized protein BN7_1870 [Wickerhamomyces ciferrii]CCH42326.1 hypothetical protein BN7_1870 [Wickerhamomyces ciferrii]
MTDIEPLNTEGKKVKITQKVKEVIVKETVNKEVAKRKKWAKFGAEKNAAPGPDFRTTQVGEPVYLRLGTAWKALEKEEEEKSAQEAAKTNTYQRIKCRTCGGAHYTAKCPHKETLGGDPAIGGGASGSPAPEDSGASGAAGASASAAAAGKYVPLHIRNRAAGIEPEKRGDRDDSNTLRVSQLNEIVTEQMIRNELFANFGPLARVNIVRNRETGRSKGLAFVQFHTESAAQRAMEALNGRGYHSLILQVEFSKPKR